MKCDASFDKFLFGLLVEIIKFGTEYSVKIEISNRRKALIIFVSCHQVLQLIEI